MYPALMFTFPHGNRGARIYPFQVTEIYTFVFVHNVMIQTQKIVLVQYAPLTSNEASTLPAHREIN